MEEKGLKIPVVAIGTDYTCIPFWEETDCDYYVIPHEDLIDEFAKRGVPREKLLPWGIPVRQNFMKEWDKREARKICHIPQESKSYLVMGGSMGFGKIQIFVLELACRMEADEDMVVICGNNKKGRGCLGQSLPFFTSNIQVGNLRDTPEVRPTLRRTRCLEPGASRYPSRGCG